jgi:hypothetical protein
MLTLVTLIAILLHDACCTAKVSILILQLEDVANIEEKLDNSTGSTTTPDTDACFSSWIEYDRVLDSLPEEAFDYVTHPMRTIVKVYETIQRIGNGSTYTECDGIARYRFQDSPTAQITSTFTVTSILSSVEKLARKEFYPHCTYDSESMCTLLGAWPDFDAPSTMMANPEGFEDITLPPGLRSPETKDAPDAFPRCRPYYEDCSYDMGEEVVLIHFPQPPPSIDSCGASLTQAPNQVPRTFITSAITFSGQDLYFRASIENGTTWLPGASDTDSPS